MEGMRTGYIRGTPGVGSQNRKVVRRTVPCACDLTGRLFCNRVEGRLLDQRIVVGLDGTSDDVRLIQFCILLIVNSESRIEQQLVALSARPFESLNEACRRYLNSGGFRRNQCADAPVISIFRLVIDVPRQLVFASHLPGEPAGAADDVTIVDAGTRQIRLIGYRSGTESVEVAVRDCLVNSPMPECKVEPQFVLHNRTADAGIEIPDFLDHADIRQEIVGVCREVAPQIASEVRRLPGSIGEASDHRSVELVAALSGNHRDADAALPHLGGIGSGDVAELLKTRVVPIDTAVCTVRAKVIEPKSVDCLHGVR